MGPGVRRSPASSSTSRPAFTVITVPARTTRSGSPWLSGTSTWKSPTVTGALTPCGAEEPLVRGRPGGGRGRGHRSAPRCSGSSSRIWRAGEGASPCSRPVRRTARHRSPRARSTTAAWSARTTAGPTSRTGPLRARSVGEQGVPAPPGRTCTRSVPGALRARVGVRRRARRRHPGDAVGGRSGLPPDQPPVEVWQTSTPRMTDNFLDITHFPFVHEERRSQQDPRVPKFELERLDDESYGYRTRSSRTNVRRHRRHREEPRRSNRGSERLPPSVRRPQHDPLRQRPRPHPPAALTPIDDETSYFTFVVWRNDDFSVPAEDVIAFDLAIGAEDKRMLEQSTAAPARPDDARQRAGRQVQRRMAPPPRGTDEPTHPRPRGG